MSVLESLPLGIILWIFLACVLSGFIQGIL